MITRSQKRLVGTGSRMGGRFREAYRYSRPWCIAVISVGMPALLGCGAQPPRYDAGAKEDPVEITAEDLGVPAEAFTGYGAKAIEADPSTGRFPAGVSVVFVKAAKDEDGLRRYLRIAEMSTVDTVLWMHLWDDQPRIREVTRLRTLGMNPRGIGYEDLLRESVNIKCDLCLVYARVHETEADAEYVAVLWDAARRRVLATFRVPTFLPDDIREQCAKSKNRDRWSDEAETRAQADLRKSVCEAMWNIVAQDQVAPATQPNPWMKYDYLPVFPRDFNRWQRVLDLQRSGAAEQGPSSQESKPSTNE